MIDCERICIICEKYGHFAAECNYKMKKITQFTYENQRWFPLVGWTSKLLPTDRFQFSSKDGKEELRKESFLLQDNEKIIDDWKINLDKCDDEGWQYAIDFPATYSPTNSKLCCVRRRKWIRTIKILELKNKNEIKNDNEFSQNNYNHTENDKKDTMFDPKYDICFKCAKRGHNFNNCPENTNTNEKSNPFFIPS